MKNILVTGAAGFIGSNFIEHMVEKYGDKYNLYVYDKLTYAGSLENLKNVEGKFTFLKEDICDFEKDLETITKYNIDAIVHFAAESHVDNSIKNPFVFTHTNVIGTHSLLEAAKRVWGEGSDNKFVHVSTDEVYGALGATGMFTEETHIAPNSPYSASKASSDLIARAYYKTFNMNVSITRCSNNYGPHQHEEKLIPLMIKKAKANEKLPVYGTGKNIRDWLFVVDHCRAIDTVLHNGKAGEVYNIGGNNEKTNLDIVSIILNTLGKSDDLITFVEDRKGHDFRYAIDSSKIKDELGWEPSVTFEEGIALTVDHYSKLNY
ncbi:MAG: dTDP-glucose 4,6-dehydratase [Bacilli bacterium]